MVVKKPTNVAGYRLACMDLALAEDPQIVVEVGVYEGGLSRLLALLPNLRQLFIVDSWEGSYSGFGKDHMEKVAVSVLAWAVKTPKVTVYRMRSTEAAPLFADNSIDFWQTDGDHSLAGITSDIQAWFPKVRPGGILSGDNYEMPTVAAGVDRLLPHRQLGAKGRFWWARKPK
jgi:hypothetical protein